MATAAKAKDKDATTEQEPEVEGATEAEETSPRPRAADVPVHVAISRVMGDIGAIAKNQRNNQQNYNYRGIDQLYDALNPALVKHGLVYLPSVEVTDRLEITSSGGSKGFHYTVSVTWTFIGPMGDTQTVGPFPGEAADYGDKGLNKAVTASFKYMAFQVFSIPLHEEGADADATSPERASSEPRQQARPSSGGGQSGPKPISSAQRGFLMKLRTKQADGKPWEPEEMQLLGDDEDENRELHAIIKAKYKVESVNDLTSQQATELIDILKDEEKRDKAITYIRTTHSRDGEG